MPSRDMIYVQKIRITFRRWKWVHTTFATYRDFASESLYKELERNELDFHARRVRKDMPFNLILHKGNRLCDLEIRQAEVSEMLDLCGTGDFDLSYSLFKELHKINEAIKYARRRRGCPTMPPLT